MENFEQVVDAITNLNSEEEQALALGIMIGITFGSGMSMATEESPTAMKPEHEKFHRQYFTRPTRGARNGRLDFYVENVLVAFDAIHKFLNLFDDISPADGFVPAKSLFDILEVTPNPYHDAVRYGWKKMALSDIRLEEREGGHYYISFPAPADYLRREKE